MTDAPTALPLLRLGRLELDPGLRALQPGLAASDLVVTAAVEVPESATQPEHAWDVALADAVRAAGRLGADERTAQALATGAGKALAGGTWVVVAAHGQVLLAQRLPRGATTASVRVGPLPHLREVAAFAARRPAHVVLLAGRDDAAVIAHAAGERQPARRFALGAGPGAQLAGRVAQAAASVAAHIVLGVGDQHVLDAVADHLPASLSPVTTIASGPVSTDSDDQFSARIGTALDGIAAGAISAVGDVVASSAAATDPVAVRGIEAVAGQLAQEQVAVLLLASDIGRDGDGASYRIGGRPTELLASGTASDSSSGTEVPLEDGLVWAALQQDAIVVQLPTRAGLLAGQPAAALLRRGQAAVSAPRSTMRSSPEAGHLDSRHQDTLRRIFQHPASHNIEWREVKSLLEAVATVTVRHDGKVEVAIGPEQEFLEPPAGKDIDIQAIVGLRQMLRRAGFESS
ncbi:MAG TPA: hypothetical protein VHZ03_54385 [Trebonia sp.]|jgi:hypothetical protein|nr:hypothetical protein [Trebonia sp.]